MKIEVGESLVRSWLRHVKGCQLVELNWKPSQNWSVQKDYQSVMDAARSYQFYLAETDIFDGTKTVFQLIKQSEIDVVGVRLGITGQVECVYGVDIAFHEGGLNYRGTRGTVTQIAKKLVRAALTLNTYFPEAPCQIAFVSPVVRNPNLINHAVDNVQKFAQEHNLNAQISLVINNEFRDGILIPTLLNSADTADSSELFLRSYRLLAHFHLLDTDKLAEHQHKPNASNALPKITRAAGREQTLPIMLDPADQDEFKRRLLKYRRAEMVVEYRNGDRQKRIWVADKFSMGSNILGNLRSRPEFRQGAWQRLGIARVVVSVST